jgi:hypothetical protein
VPPHGISRLAIERAGARHGHVHGIERIDERREPEKLDTLEPREHELLVRLGIGDELDRRALAHLEVHVTPQMDRTGEEDGPLRDE